MKLTPSLLLGAALLPSILLSSCGKKNDPAAGDPDSANSEKVEKKETPDTLTDELAVEMNAFCDAILSAKDKASAEATVSKIDSIGDNLADIAARLDKLETPSDEEKLALDAKMDKVTEAIKAKMKSGMPALMQNPEVSQLLTPAMKRFGERMEANDKVFERFGKEE